MDQNAMFPGIINSISENGPKSSNLVAEPAQVMVLVPGTRAKEAENSLAKLKTYIYLFCFIVLLIFVCIFMYYFYRRKSRYEGRELPGAYETNLTSVDKIEKIDEPFRPERTEKLDRPDRPERPERPNVTQEKITVESFIQPVEDIIDITGEIPTWNLSDDVAPIENDEKVSENSAEINALIKSREALTQHFEKMISKQ